MKLDPSVQFRIRKGYHSSQRLAVLLVAGLFAADLIAQEAPKSTGTNALPPPTPPVVELSDGTPVQLRLAQSVRGTTHFRGHLLVYSRSGEKLRLVAAEDVIANGLVVICKGALGQATVTKADPPVMTHSHGKGSSLAGDLLVDMLIPSIGAVYLQLDWIEDIAGHRIPLRAAPTGNGKPFIMSVRSGNGGATIRPANIGRDLKEAAHTKLWAPSGTRIFAFVHGTTKLDSAELEQAQALLPMQNPTALLMVYRMKGHRTDQPELSCDDSKPTPIGERQYVTLELKSGKHTCRIGDKDPVGFTAEAGQEYFLQLQHRKLASAWELRHMANAEGEDSLSGLEELAVKP